MAGESKKACCLISEILNVRSFSSIARAFDF